LNENLHNPQPDAMGIPAKDTLPALQSDAFKEIVNKLAWALGTTYRVPYRNPRAGARLVAIRLAGLTIDSEGYPPHIAA